MATLSGEGFSLFEPGAGGPAVWCSSTFRLSVRAAFAGGSDADRASFSNVSELIKRFAKGEQMSRGSFRKEDVGFAFAAGKVRVYGVYSKNHRRCFVLSHVILKRHQKLARSDKRTMSDCRNSFDALDELPAP